MSEAPQFPAGQELVQWMGWKASALHRRDIGADRAACGQKIGGTHPRVQVMVVDPAWWGDYEGIRCERCFPSERTSAREEWVTLDKLGLPVPVDVAGALTVELHARITLPVRVLNLFSSAHSMRVHTDDQDVLQAALAPAAEQITDADRYLRWVELNRDAKLLAIPYDDAVLEQALTGLRRLGQVSHPNSLLIHEDDLGQLAANL